MALALSGSFGWAGGGKSGATVDIWAASRFSGVPVQGQAPPSGFPDAGPVLTGDDFGNPGAFYISGIATQQDYYIRIQYGGETYWGERSAGSLIGASGGGGGGGGGTAMPFPFTFGAGYAAGSPIFVPVDQTWLRDWWVYIETANNGLTPKIDLGFLSSGNEGFLTSVGAQPIPAGIPDISVPGNAELLYTPQSASWGSAIETLGFTAGPPVLRSQTAFSNPGAVSLFLIISQDGTTNTGAGATLTAQVAPVGGTSPYTVSHNVNDQFIFYGIDPVGGGGAAAPETFKFNTGGGTVNFTGLAALAAGMGAALGSSSEPFSNYVTCGTNAGATKLELTVNPPSAAAGVFPGAASNGCVLSAGFHDALAGLGFTGANVFAGGIGGDPGAMAGAGILYLDIVTPT